MDFFLSPNNLWILLIALISGAMLAWPSLSRGRSGSSISLAEAIQLVNRENGLFVDVRPAEQFKTGSIPQARNVPHDTLDAQAGSLPRNKPIILVDARGRESAKAAATLRKQGFDRVSCLEGGLAAWAEGGMPVTKT